MVRRLDHSESLETCKKARMLFFYVYSLYSTVGYLVLNTLPVYRFSLPFLSMVLLGWQKMNLSGGPQCPIRSGDLWGGAPVFNGADARAAVIHHSTGLNPGAGGWRGPSPVLQAAAALQCVGGLPQTLSRDPQDLHCQVIPTQSVVVVYPSVKNHSDLECLFLPVLLWTSVGSHFDCDLS